MRKIVSDIIFGIVICIFGYLVIANMSHIIYLNQYNTFNFNNQHMTTIKTNINQLESNINKIGKLDNSVLTTEELKSITETLELELKNIKASKLLNYEGEQKIYLKDLFNIDLDNKLSASGNIKILETLAKHNESINNYLEIYKHDLITNAYYEQVTSSEARFSYRYNTVDYFNAYLIETGNTGISARVYRFGNHIIKENYLAELVLEIGGGINE
ncbi:MAG: hypothetical protein PHT75_00350 [Bacilli bacterium]|nr:hypothetical protein [Bacilli bacterium]MDD3304571.1 hypothetical protein [Bacilli bacterium]MDD4053813.1 hypothetical protein [Bacilli bacterium]MDD4411320.1 hypothetical protein [Bacilli bacterium]